MTTTPEQVERVARALWNKRIPFETWVEAQEAALAALTAAGQGWRPIETAPKDGTRIIAGWATGTGIVIARFYGGIWCPDGGVLASSPTHWQPLPAPPSTEEVT